MKRLITLFTLLTMLAIGVQAQIVGANEGPKTSSNTSSSLYKPTGHYLRFEVGFPNPSVAYAYQLSPTIMIGSGLGIGGMYYDVQNYSTHGGESRHSETRLGIPIYVEASLSQPKYKWALLLDFKIGICIPLEKNYREWSSMATGTYEHFEEYRKGRIVFGAIYAGISYKNFSLCGGVTSNHDEWISYYVSYNLPLRINR